MADESRKGWKLCFISDQFGLSQTNTHAGSCSIFSNFRKTLGLFDCCISVKGHSNWKLGECTFQAGRTDCPCNLKKSAKSVKRGWSCRWSTYYFALLFSLFNKLMPLHVVDEEVEEEEEGSGSAGGEAEVEE